MANVRMAAVLCILFVQGVQCTTKIANSNVVAALMLPTLALLGNAFELRARNAKDSQQILMGKEQMAVDQAKLLQRARECEPGPFPYHQMAVHGQDFKEAVASYATKLGSTASEKILGYAKNHDFGYNEAVKQNGYTPAPLYDMAGDLIADIQTRTSMDTAFGNKDGHPFYNADGTALHEELTQASSKPEADLRKEDFGQLHEAFSAFLYITSGDVDMSAIDDSQTPGANVAGMVLIAGTLAPTFGSPFERVKILHAAVKRLSSSSGDPMNPDPYSANGSCKNLFNKMVAVVSSESSLTQVVEVLTLQQWFDAGTVGDFLYITQFDKGSICKQANCLAEFWAYGGVEKASKGAIKCEAPNNGCLNDTQKSWNAFWLGQPFFANKYVVSMMKVPEKAGIDPSVVVQQMEEANKVMEEIKSGCRVTGSYFHGCQPFKDVCEFDPQGFWKKKSVSVADSVAAGAPVADSVAAGAASL